MTTYVSAVPLAMVRTVEGSYRNVYQDEPIEGEAVEPENLKRLVRKGFLVESAADAAEGPPAKGAKLEVWQDYARTQGATDEDLDGVTKADLIAAYGEQD